MCLDTPGIDEKEHGNLVGLANEMDRISGDLSDSNVKSAVSSIVYMLGGVAGYTVGAVIDSLNYLVMLI